MARLLLGVTGGVAAYKAVELVRLAGRAGHSVRVIATQNGLRFVGEATFAGITGAPVLTDEFARDPLRGSFPGDPPPAHDPIGHLALVENADLYLIAPASANTLAKLAGGYADNLVTVAALAAGCPVVVAPAMNHRMWQHPATVENVARLRARGVTVVDPEEGELASRGEHGTGRLAEPPDLLAACEALLGGGGALAGLRVLVTAGGTREPLDSVRFLGNRSSGRMGVALAGEAARRGAAVTLVAANVALPMPPGVTVLRVETAEELHDTCVAEFPRSDILLMAAAVADFRPARAAATKLKKDRGVPELALEPTPDILSALSEQRRPGQTLVGFAAEHGEGGIEHARGKLERKRLDAVVVNDIARSDIGFDSRDNEVVILSRDGIEHPVARAAKERVAAAVLDEVRRLREGEDTGAARSAPAGRPARV